MVLWASSISREAIFLINRTNSAATESLALLSAL